jgi:PTS system nitrogen regulatory IIA component
MDIMDLLTPERVVANAQAGSKKRVLELISGLLAESAPALTEEEIFESLIGRERLGSTGLGHGVALPHARLAGQEEAIGGFVKLEQGIDFDAIDGQPVDMLFALLVPEHFTDEHLDILARLARMFSDDALCQKIRKSNTAEQMLELIRQQTKTTTA